MKRYEALDFIGQFSQIMRDGDFDAQENCLQNLDVVLKKYPDFASYVESDFKEILKKKYISDFIVPYTDVYLDIFQTKSAAEQKKMLAFLNDMPRRFMLVAQDKIMEKFPQHVVQIVQERIECIERLGFETGGNLNVVSAIANIEDDVLCQKMLQRTFSSHMNFFGETENILQLPEVFEKHRNLGDFVLNLLNKHQNNDAYFAAIADFAVVEEYKTEEAMHHMHERIQNKEVDEELLSKYYKALDKVATKVPKFKSLAQEYIKEAMTYKQNGRKSLRCAAKALNDEKMLSSQSYIGKRTKKSDANKHGYENVKSVEDDEICVLCVGGNATTEEYKAHGYVKQLQEFVKECGLQDKVNVYGITYDFGEYFAEKKALGKQMLDYGHIHYSKSYVEDLNQDTVLPQFIEQIFDKFVLPRISKNKTERLDAQQAAQKINKFKMLVHCFGGYVALKLEEIALNKMQQLGYSAAEQDYIIRRMQILAISPHCPLGVSKSNMLSVISAQDGQVTHGNYFEKQIRKMVVGGKIVPPCVFPKEQGDFILVNRIFGKDNKKYDGHDEDEHNFCGLKLVDAMSKGGLTAVGFARSFLQKGLNNAINNDITPITLEQALNGNENELAVLAMMKENGRLLWDKITTDTLKEQTAIFNKKYKINR